jgi:hypothetical protein
LRVIVFHRVAFMAALLASGTPHNVQVGSGAVL